MIISSSYRQCTPSDENGLAYLLAIVTAGNTQHLAAAPSGINGIGNK